MKKVYKLRSFKDKAYKRYKAQETVQKGQAVVELPDGQVGEIATPWLINYFPFRGIVTQKTKTSVDVQIYGVCTVELNG